jgi:hypothetical protein
MPHKLPVGKATHYGIGCIAQRPELAQLAGQVASDWSYFERILGEMYARLMGRMYIADRMPPGTQVSHPIALQIFEEIESFRGKQNLLNALIKWAFIKCPDDFKAYEDATYKPIKVAYFARNKVVHGLWGICDDYPNALILHPIFGHRLVWKASDFGEELKKIRECLVAFGQATAKLEQFIRGDVASPCSQDIGGEPSGL